MLVHARALARSLACLATERPKCIVAKTKALAAAAAGERLCDASALLLGGPLKRIGRRSQWL